MTDEPDSAGFELNAPGVDAAALVRDIRETVARKTAEGVYQDARIARAERHNLANLSDSGELLRFYLSCLRDTVHIDISDYTIKDRRGGVAGKMLVKFKTVMWKLLKFYTYRLWSQQNTINGLLVTGVETLDEKYREQIKRLEARVADLEKRLSGKEGA